jgi:hypothetical protein
MYVASSIDRPLPTFSIILRRIDVREIPSGLFDLWANVSRDIHEQTFIVGV